MEHKTRFIFNESFPIMSKICYHPVFPINPHFNTTKSILMVSQSGRCIVKNRDDSIIGHFQTLLDSVRGLSWEKVLKGCFYRMKKDGPKHKTELFPKLQSGRSQTTENGCSI